jgi:BolA protein
MDTMDISAEIAKRLQTFEPEFLEVIDDTASHHGHLGAAQHTARTGAISGTHFEVRITSPLFAGKPPVTRHRMIHAVLDDLLKTRIHALSIDARAPRM